jgi:hypothetical protein
MKVSLNQQDGALSFFAEGNCKIERNGRLSIVRQRTGNQESFEVLLVPNLVKTQP